jgi:hypothetical protein
MEASNSLPTLNYSQSSVNTAHHHQPVETPILSSSMSNESSDDILLLRDLNVDAVSNLFDKLGFKDCIPRIHEFQINGELLDGVETLEEFKEFEFPIRFTAECRVLFNRLMKLKLCSENISPILNNQLESRHAISSSVVSLYVYILIVL